MVAIPDYRTIASALRDAGLTPRGGFLVESTDGVPAMANGARAVTLILAGNVGGGMWQAFSGDHPGESASNEHHATLLDDWSRKALVRVADVLGGPTRCRPLFPFEGPPFLPFVRWARRAEPVFPSPVGPLIHPEYGLWHAYRGALAFPRAIGLPPRPDRENPCEICEGRPCLSGCPVGAHDGNAFDLARCVGHIDSGDGADCMAEGCLARRACPVGRAWRYAPGHARFHMTAFRRANRTGRDVGPDQDMPMPLSPPST